MLLGLVAKKVLATAYFEMTGNGGYDDLSANDFTIVNSGTVNTPPDFVCTPGDYISVGTTGDFSFPTKTGIISLRVKFNSAAYTVDGAGLVAAPAVGVLPNEGAGFALFVDGVGGTSNLGSWPAKSLSLVIYSGNGIAGPAVCFYSTPLNSIQLSTDYDVIIAVDVASGLKYCSINGTPVAFTGVDDATEINPALTTDTLYVGGIPYSIFGGGGYDGTVESVKIIDTYDINL